MATLMIGYDLNSPGQNYEDLISQIKSYGTWWHHLDSTWLIVTSQSVTKVRDQLMQHIDSGDELLALDVSSDPWAGSGFTQRAYNWLRNNL